MSVGARVTVEQWKGHRTGALFGFATVTLASGLTIHGIAVFEKDGERWLKLPPRRWQNRAGEWMEEQILEIRDGDRRKRFQGSVLAALRSEGVI